MKDWPAQLKADAIREPFNMDLEARFSGPLAHAVDREARRRGVTPGRLVADVIEHVAADGLFAAVLDG